MFDIVIVGLGASGGLLLLELMEQNFSGSVLVLEQKQVFENDKTWSFWEKEHSIIDEFVHKIWGKAKFYGEDKQIDLKLSPYVYKTVRSIDFYTFLLKEIGAHQNITLLQEEVIELTEQSNNVMLQTERGVYQARQVFDSRPPKLESNIGVMQHFLGWIVRTKQPVFDATTFTMMDFRTNDSDTTNFMYVLPYSATEALVEFTYFSNEIPPKATYRLAIQHYCKTVLKLEDYDVVEEEYGVIPMLMQDFSISSTQRVIRIGTAGGAVKPSSGYSFMHSRKRAQELVCELMKNEPLSLNSYKPRHRFYDKIFLSILEEHNSVGEQLFTTMYTKNDIETIFRFLDEDSSLVEELSIIGSFATSKQVGLFLKAFFTTL